MSIVYIIGVISLIWFLYHYYTSKAIIGKRVTLKPFRQQSVLHQVGAIIGSIESLHQLENDDMLWFILRLKEPLKLGKETYTYLLIKPKSVDDKINNKKAVIVHVKGFSKLTPSDSVFIDWGLVIIQ